MTPIESTAAGADPAQTGTAEAHGELPASVDVLIIGGGQAGLGMAYRLKGTGASTLIVDDRARTGDVWRARWRSLVLFTPKRFAALPGLPMPAGTSYYPKREEMADYLETYARVHELPIAHRTRVTAVRRDGEAFVVDCESHGRRREVRARAVVVASGPFQYSRVPRVAAGLADRVAQVHSSAYREASDLPVGRTAVVGGGNSAAQLAVELSASREVTMVAPTKPWFIPERILGLTVYWPLKLFGILTSPANSRISQYIHSRGDGILGTDAKRAVRQGRMRMRSSRVIDAEGTELVLADGSRLEVDAVLWATGFRTHYPFIQVPEALTEHGAPRQSGGVSPVPGLFWLGLPWQTRLDSSIVHGIAADSRDLVPPLQEHLREHPRAHLGEPQPLPSATMEP